MTTQNRQKSIAKKLCKNTAIKYGCYFNLPHKFYEQKYTVRKASSTYKGSIIFPPVRFQHEKVFIECLSLTWSC